MAVSRSHDELLQLFEEIDRVNPKNIKDTEILKSLQQKSRDIDEYLI